MHHYRRVLVGPSNARSPIWGPLVRRIRWRTVAAAFWASVSVASVLSSSQTASASAELGPYPLGLVIAAPVVDCAWLTPVNAAIVDPFRAPAGPYGPGNRGIEYGTIGDETVVAVDDGRVSFAGPVGGRRYVVIGHGGGLRSTYGPLASISVVRGQQVGAGVSIGLAGRGMHLTARHLDQYLDPGPLLDGVCGRLRLVDGHGS